MDKGAALNKRVWTLFQKAGFQTKPNSADLTEFLVTLTDKKQRPVDLHAAVPDLGVSLIGSNKSGKNIPSFTTHIHDLENLTKSAGVDCALFVSLDKEIQTNEIEFAKRHGVHVWNEQSLAYYEAVADTLGRYAKYEMIHSLGLTTSEEALKDTVLAIRLRQPRSGATGNTELYMFTLPAEKLLKTSVVLRKAEGRLFAYQRLVSRKRLPKIGEFVGTPEALVPTNLVVHLSDDITIDEVRNEFKDVRGNKVTPARKDHQLVSLTIPLQYGSMEVIDGQHRLFGFVHTDDATKKNFNLVVLGLRNMDQDRRSKTFVAINDNARRADPNLVSYLRYTDNEKACKQDPDLMAIKLVVELNKQSPFKKAIRLFDMGVQRLTLKGLSGYDLRGLVASRGLLRLYYPANTSKTYLNLLRRYYGVIKEIFPTEWADPDRYVIATNRGFTAFLKLLRSILKTEGNRVSRNVIKKYVRALRQHWSGPWETKKLKASYVGSQGWKGFHRDMVQAIQRKYRTFQE